jgi:hypothetical protein
MNACQRGTHSELLFCTEAGRRGWGIYVPFGHAQMADVILFKPPYNPITVQVKTATYERDKDRYGVSVSRGLDKSLYTSGDFTILAAWIPEADKFVLWRFDEICERKKISYTPRLHRQPDNWEILDTVLK